MSKYKPGTDSPMDPTLLKTEVLPAETEAVSETVTYLPGPEGPASTKWMGHVFHANAPKTVTNALLIEKARTNRHFKVGAFDPAKDTVETVEAAPGPKTSDQYRAHAVAWLKKMQSVDDLDRKWASEEVLRIKCEVGTDDIDFLRDLFEPYRAELRKREMAG